MIFRRRAWFCFELKLLCLITAVLSGSVWGISQLKQYQPAPAFDLEAIAPEGMHVNNKTLRGKPAILVFGELYNNNTIACLYDLEKIRTDLELTREDISVYLIVAQDASTSKLLEARQDKKIKAEILRDSQRRAYGTYGVVVLPSVVVLDSKGNVSLAVSGYPLSFSDMMTDAVLYSLGKTTRQQFEASVQIPSAAAPTDEAKLRAARLAGLAHQLLRRGYTELAQQRYEQTLQEDPNYLEGRVGLARCLIKLNNLAAAAQELEKVLRQDENHNEANLVLAQLEIIRGGEEIKTAQKRLEAILLRNSRDPETLYLLGMVYEKENDKEKSLSYYKKAAQLLLEIQGP